MIRTIAPFFAWTLLASVPALASEIVPVPHFDSVELRGGGEVTLVPGAAQRVTILNGGSQFTHIYMRRNGQLRIDACNERCPQHYNLQIRIESPRAPDVAIDGGGTIIASSGFAPQGHLSAAVNGGGSIDARSIQAAEVSAAVRGGGKIAVRPRASLSAAVMGGGEIRYGGNPSVSMAVSGGGDVRREN